MWVSNGTLHHQVPLNQNKLCPVRKALNKRKNCFVPILISLSPKIDILNEALFCHPHNCLFIPLGIVCRTTQLVVVEKKVAHKMTKEIEIESELI